MSDSAEAKYTLHFPESQNQEQTVKIFKINVALDRKFKQTDVIRCSHRALNAVFRGYCGDALARDQIENRCIW